MLAQSRALGDDLAHRLRPLLVPPDPFQPPSHRPPPVAIHDDGDVPREALRLNVRQGSHLPQDTRPARWMIVPPDPSLPRSENAVGHRGNGAGSGGKIRG